MDMTRGKIHKEGEKARGFPYGLRAEEEESCTKTLQKFYVNCSFPPLRKRFPSAILYTGIQIEKGGIAMMMWKVCGHDDVDDLIFTETGWEHSER